MTVLDTDFLIHAMKGDEAAARLLRGLVESFEPIAISAITVMELHHALPRVRDRNEEAERIARGLRGITTYAITHEIAAKAGEIDGTLARAGSPIGVQDCLIAATALDHGEPVLTRNTKHFNRVAGVAIRTY
jgi:tRNA(fMet)-specific endonuclease VapC